MKPDKDVQEIANLQDCSIEISKNLAGSLMCIGVDLLDEVSPQYEEEYNKYENDISQKG